MRFIFSIITRQYKCGLRSAILLLCEMCKPSSAGSLIETEPSDEHLRICLKPFSLDVNCGLSDMAGQAGHARNA